MSLDVNNLLHTLRGEQFRHAQNLRRSRSHLVAALNAYTHNTPTLPRQLIYDPPPEQQQHDIPTSTTSPNVLDNPLQQAIWRAQALSITFPHLSPHSSGHPPPFPSLTLLCLRVLTSAYPISDFASYVVPYLPLHLRRVLLRDAAIHAPLSSAKLYALCEPLGHADGELIVVGPHATLPKDYFQKVCKPIEDRTFLHHAHDQTSGEELSWDSPALQDEVASAELHTIVILSCSISAQTLLTFPPTITHLALINIPAPVALHRLPGICPLIVILDLSYNKWANPASKEVENVFCRVAWTRWNRLEKLGLRECIIPKVILDRVNEGRWNDVEVIL